MEQKATDESLCGDVTISPDYEIRLNATIYQAHFIACEYVRLGTHPDLDLIFVQPVAESDDVPAAIRKTAYKIDDTKYTGEITCQTFLEQHNYHHTETTQYVAEWWGDYEVLCVDLTDPADSQYP